MKKGLFFLFLSMVLIMSLVFGCGRAEEASEKVEGQAELVEPKTVSFYYPDGLPALTAAKIAKEKPSIDENIVIDYQIQKTPDLLASKIIKGEADIAIVPSNLAVQAFNKGIPYKLVGTSTWGSLYIISRESIEDFEGFKGKEIYSFARGLTPDIVLRYIFLQNNIDPDKDLQITYLNSGSEVAPAFLGGKTNLALVSEPLASNILMKENDAKVIFSLNQEWAKITESEYGYPQSSLIIKSDLIEEEREFVEGFLEIYQASSNWAIRYPEELGDYAEELGIGVEKNAIIEGQDRMNTKFMDVKDCREEYEIYFKTMLEFAPESIGGKLPDEGFYFER